MNCISEETRAVRSKEIEPAMRFCACLILNEPPYRELRSTVKALLLPFLFLLSFLDKFNGCWKYHSEITIDQGWIEDRKTGVH
jgi:hypothetical protein